MRHLIITALLFVCCVSNAQEFNSVRKPLMLNKVSVREAIDVIESNEIADVKRSEKEETFLNSSDQFQPVETISKIRIEKPTIQFSTPLAELNKTSGYGLRFHPILKKWRFHAGVDLASNADTVYSMLSGTVKDSGYSSTLGYYVRTQHSNGEIEVLYAHLSEYNFLKGESINAGEPLGITGSTGLSTGDHLHLGVYKNGKHTNPIKFMSEIVGFNNTITRYNDEQQNKRESNIISDGDIRTGYVSNTNK